MKPRKGLTGLTVKPKSKAKVPKISSSQTWLDIAFDEKYKDTRPLWGKIREVENGWTPSTMGNGCDRLTLLGPFGYRGDPIPPKLRRIFDRGKKIEEQWQQYFREMRLLLKANIRLRRDVAPIISGEYDVLVKHAYEPRQLLGEIKSINGAGFKQLPAVTLDPQVNFEALTSGGGFIGDRLKKYMYQLQTYLYVTGIEEGFILFDNKDNQDYANFVIHRNPEFVEREFERLTRLNDYRERLVVARCTCDRRSGLACQVHPEEELELQEYKELFAAEETF
jgi:hypothetical protein